MRVDFKVSNLFTVSGEGTTQKEAFQSVAACVEPFAIDECGNCQSDNIFPRVRNQGKFTYYEMQCRKCWARLSYGQSTENGALYPRRKYHDKHPLVKSGEVKEGDKIPNGGWQVWVKDADEEEGETVKTNKVAAKKK